MLRRVSGTIAPPAAAAPSLDVRRLLDRLPLHAGWP
jgi:hypothetical protein